MTIYIFSDSINSLVQRSITSVCYARTARHCFNRPFVKTYTWTINVFYLCPVISSMVLSSFHPAKCNKSKLGSILLFLELCHLPLVCLEDGGCRKASGLFKSKLFWALICFVIGFYIMRYFAYKTLACWWHWGKLTECWSYKGFILIVCPF